jgi:hypothetical protein
MYEFVSNPQKMIDEVWRITKFVAIFGFVGKDYKPYRIPWRYYDGKEIIPSVKMKVDFNYTYHFIICER